MKTSFCQKIYGSLYGWSLERDLQESIEQGWRKIHGPSCKGCGPYLNLDSFCAYQESISIKVWIRTSQVFQCYCAIKLSLTWGSFDGVFPSIWSIWNRGSDPSSSVCPKWRYFYSMMANECKEMKLPSYSIGIQPYFELECMQWGHHRVGKVLSSFSSRWNWASPSPFIKKLRGRTVSKISLW